MTPRRREAAEMESLLRITTIICALTCIVLEILILWEGRRK